MNPIERILVANRGEIAVRIMKTAQKMGIQTVAVFSEADRGAPHVRIADRAECIGPASVDQSYLLTDKVLEAARIHEADAIHPGYGLLSEDAEFAETCERNGLIFIGPAPGQLREFGLKHRARALATETGVPLAPGSDLISDPESAEQEAKARQRAEEAAREEAPLTPRAVSRLPSRRPSPRRSRAPSSRSRGCWGSYAAAPSTTRRAARRWCRGRRGASPGRPRTPSVGRTFPRPAARAASAATRSRWPSRCSASAPSSPWCLEIGDGGGSRGRRPPRPRWRSPPTTCAAEAIRAQSEASSAWIGACPDRKRNRAGALAHLTPQGETSDDSCLV